MALGTTNISTSLVAQTIGEGSNDVGTLCKSAKINKWSKWKPVKLAQVVGIDETQLKTINYGLTFPRTNVYNVIAQQKWSHDRPAGTATTPYRIGDFRGYKHDAVKLVNCPQVTEINIFENPNDTLTFQFATAAIGQLQMADFTGTLASQYRTFIVLVGADSMGCCTVFCCVGISGCCSTTGCCSIG